MNEVEKKNRMLNDKINEIIYNKAATYKERTLEVLKKNPEQLTPRGRYERQEQFGIEPESQIRLREALQQEKMTTEKALNQIGRVIRQQSPARKPFAPDRGLTNYAVVHNLERLENQQEDTYPPMR